MGKYFDELTARMKKINADFLEEVKDKFGSNISEELLEEMIGVVYKMELLEDEMERELRNIQYVLEDAEALVSEANSL